MHPPRGIPDRPWRPCPDRAAGGAFGPSRVPEVQHVPSVGARRKTDRPFGGRAGGCTPRDPSFVRGARGRSTGDQWGRGPLGVPVPSPRWPLQGVGVGEGVPPTPSSTSPAVGSMHPPSRPAAPFRAEGPERPAAGEASPGPEPRGGDPWGRSGAPIPPPPRSGRSARASQGPHPRSSLSVRGREATPRTVRIHGGPRVARGDASARRFRHLRVKGRPGRLPVPVPLRQPRDPRPGGGPRPRPGTTDTGGPLNPPSHGPPSGPSGPGGRGEGPSWLGRAWGISGVSSLAPFGDGRGPAS